MKELLEKIINEHDLINQTFKGFWEAYDNYLFDEDSKEEIEEYGLVDRNSIKAKLYMVIRSGFQMIWTLYISKCTSIAFLKVNP